MTPLLSPRGSCGDSDRLTESGTAWEAFMAVPIQLPLDPTGMQLAKSVRAASECFVPSLTCLFSAQQAILLEATTAAWLSARLQLYREVVAEKLADETRATCATGGWPRLGWGANIVSRQIERIEPSNFRELRFA